MTALDPTPLSIRPGRPEDVGEMINLFKRSVHEIARADYSPTQLAAWAPESIDPSRWLDRLSAQEIRLAETADQLVGFCTWTADGYLDLLFVHPGHVRRGIARMLYAEAEKSLQERNVTRIHTQASITAQPFFLRQGFHPVKPQTVSVRGVELPNTVMEKRLA